MKYTTDKEPLHTRRRGTTSIDLLDILKEVQEYNENNPNRKINVSELSREAIAKELRLRKTGDPK